ncbi:MAG: NAD(P)/FAD-dependent oxidoreductase [Armatimonadetes bacterium]|nr:NAD(P)/FAD-dependent oxidoreductase [Armatimonadota bacterium]
MSARQRVVIIGGGFGGLYTAKALANRNLDVTLIDRKNHHTFQPLLYQVATTVLSPNQIAVPLRSILRKAKNIEVLLGTVTSIDTVGRKVMLESGAELDYDFLVVAAGARHSYFGHDEWAKDAPGLKTVEDATEIRKRILSAFEEAEREAFLTGNHTPVNFAIVGGGPTGVELAGAIAGIARQALVEDFHEIDTRKARVMLFEGMDRILGMYPPELSASAERQLAALGVEVHTKSPVIAIESGRIRVGEEWIPSKVTLWATGVAASPLGKMLSSETDRAGRVPVQPDLSLRDHPEIFVIGDMASLKDTKGVAVPALGSSATQMGVVTARNILRQSDGQPTMPFTYKDKGTMATIGRNRAICLIGSLKLSGFIAWLAWGLVHVLLLIGFKNKFLVLLEWFWSYLTGRGSVRLITTPGDQVHPTEAGQ